MSSYNVELFERFKKECRKLDGYTPKMIRTQTWADIIDVEIAPFEWVKWWNDARLHQSLGYHTSAEIESEF